MQKVAVILLLMWGIFFLSQKRKLKSGIVYFAFLFFMILPSLLKMNYISSYIINGIDYRNIVVFSVLLILGFIPWLVFDRTFSIYSYRLIVDEKYIHFLKFIFKGLIISSLFSIFYLLPYAIQGVLMGAAERRATMVDGGVLPSNIVTTLVVGISGLNIFNVLFFYISCLHIRLYKYRFWLLISSFSYLVNSFAFAGRDGLIILPVFYAVFFVIFRKSINNHILKSITKMLSFMMILVAIFFAIFSVNRFFSDKDMNVLYDGTLGYISQQPYVFDSTIKYQNDFHGWELRFPLINRLLGVSKYDVERTGGSFDTQFGTMYSEFYSIEGWKSLLLISFVFVSYYSFAVYYLRRRRKMFGLFMIFAVYLYIVISGLFYCKAGSTILINIFYIILSIIPFFFKNYILIEYDNNRYSNN